MSAEKVQPLNPLFDKQLIAAFVEGVIKVMGDMAQTKVSPGKPIIEQKKEGRGEVAGIIGMVSGDYKGSLLIAYSKDSILHILENMIGEKYEDITPEATDAVGELTNMIYGAAKTVLNQMGYSFEMAIPTVVKGQFRLAQLKGAITLSIPFKIDDTREFHVEITVQ